MIKHTLFISEFKRYLENYQCNESDCGIVHGDIGAIISFGIGV